MKLFPLIASAVVLCAAMTTSVHALDFRAVGAAPAILYDAPSEKGRRTNIAPRGMPVEVVTTYGDWSKVRDADGKLTWIMSKALVTKRNVIITASNAKIHAAADDNSPVVFSADKNVLLELSDPVPVSGWLKVKHRDGQSGFIKSGEVWGD
jgi:SH3-like domain-containing protein